MTKFRVNFKNLNGLEEIYVSDLRTIFRLTYSEARACGCNLNYGEAMIWKVTDEKPSFDDEPYILMSVWRDGTITMNYKNKKFITIKYGERINEI